MHEWIIEGLPPQVLIHHQKMHNITTPELPVSVKMARDEFLHEQQKEQPLPQAHSESQRQAEPKPQTLQPRQPGLDASQNNAA